MSSIESDPEEVFRRDFFLDRPSQIVDAPKLVSKAGGERTSFYQSLASSRLALTTEMYCKHR